jgi:hypothetical protein
MNEKDRKKEEEARKKSRWVHGCLFLVCDVRCQVITGWEAVMCNFV